MTKNKLFRTKDFTISNIQKNKIDFLQSPIFHTNLRFAKRKGLRNVFCFDSRICLFLRCFRICFFEQFKKTSAYNSLIKQRLDLLSKNHKFCFCGKSFSKFYVVSLTNLDAEPLMSTNRSTNAYKCSQLFTSAERNMFLRSKNNARKFVCKKYMQIKDLQNLVKVDKNTQKERLTKFCFVNKRTQKFIKKLKKKNICNPFLKSNIWFIKAKVCFFSRTKKTHLYNRTPVVTNIFWYSTYKTSYTMVRPLMNCLRCNITIACILSGLPVYPDLSNLEIRYSRNRIRKQIIPTMKFFLNPKVERTLFQFSEFYNIERSLWNN